MIEPHNDMTPGLMSGRLEGMSVPDLMWALCSRGAGGVLRVTRDGIRKTVYFDAGRIVFAASSDPDERLGELFLRQGTIGLDALERALGKLGSGKRLGTILVEAGDLSPQALVDGVMTQVREIVLDLFNWESGEYGFEPGPLPTREVITLDMRTGELLLRGIRRIRSFTRIRRSVGPPRTVYRLTPEAREILDGLSLESGEGQLTSRLEGGPRSIEELCRDVHLSNFEVYQTLWGFRVLGIVTAEERGGGMVEDAVVAGRFGAETVIPLLVRLGRAGETGVLYLSCGTRERSLHVRDGQVVFATSNDIDDGLIAYLLRRGVISLRDREETARRLLSNKRVGTILREMGVIDDLDLRSMVREHLAEVVQDTLAWPEGEYAFVPGELPTIEEITLDLTLESLVAGAVRRMRSWSRVRDGLGGVRRRLALSPDFLAVLDRMHIGPAEWEVVTALKDPATVLDVCRKTGLGDFQVSQILWCLDLLGAAETAPEEQTRVRDAGEEAIADESRTSVVTMPADLAFQDPAGDGATPDEVEPEAPEEPTVEPEEVVLAAGTDPEPDADPSDGLVAPVADAEPEPESRVFTADTGVDAPVANAEPEPELQVVTADTEVDAPDERREAPVHELRAPDRPESVPVATWSVLGEMEGDDDETAGSPSGWVVDDVPGWGAPSFEETGRAGAGGASEPEPEDPVLEESGWTTGAWGDAEESSVDLPADDVPAEPETILEEAGPSPEPESLEVAEERFEPEARPARLPDETQTIDPEVVRAALSGEDDGGDRLEAAETVVAQEGFEDRAFDGPAPFETAGPDDGGVDAQEPEDGWAPPADLDEQIARFNARQRVLYRTIRAEVGAGAVNFVRSCCGKAGAVTADVFDDVELRADGTWDSESLRQAIVAQRLEDPSAEYERLIELEFDLLRVHIGDARARSLREQIDKAASTQPSV